MKKHNWLVAKCLIALACLLYTVIPAIPASAVLLPDSGASDLLFGEQHDYSVVLRGNTESIVYARISLTNNTESTLSRYKFEVPELDVTDMVGYQIELAPSCSSYDYSVQTGRTYPCLKYAAPDYSSRYYESSNAEYHKLKFSNDGNHYTVDLPKPVDPEASTALLISYAGKGYVKQSLGLYRFNFETLKVDQRIKQATVAVDVDSDLVMEGKRSKVNYQGSTAPSSGVNSGAELSLGSKAALDSAVSSIGSVGVLIKNAKNLAANETLTVRGKYAASAWRLNLNKIVISVAVLGAIVALVWFLARRAQRRKAVTVTSAKKSQTIVNTSSVKLLQPLTVLAGLVSAVAVAAGSVLVSYLSKWSQDQGGADVLSGIIFLVITLLFYLLAIFGIALWFAIARKSWKLFLYIIFWEFAWLIVLAAVYQWGLKDVLNQTVPPEIYPAADTMELRAD